MRVAPKLFLATLTALLMAVGMAGAAAAGPLDDADAAAERALNARIDAKAAALREREIEDALSAEGRGDLTTALYLLRRNRGDARAVRYLEELKAKMTPAQIADAEKLAQIKDGVAAMNLGSKDSYATALQLLRPLAEQGDARAQYYLGRLYSLGGGVPESELDAVKWYREAAEQGYAMAQYQLGRAYEKGVGVLRDVIPAHMWLNLAAAGGQRGAADERDKLEMRMTPAQITEAEKLTRQWKPTIPPEKYGTNEDPLMQKYFGKATPETAR
jgi:hypothetical protein